MKGMIAPSMMCASIANVKEELMIFEKENIEYLHIDVMDGVFVPNFMLCDGISKQYRQFCHIPFDYHLMIVEPFEKIDWFDIRQGDLMSIHLESCKNIKECLQKIRNKGAKAGLAIKPITEVKNIKPYLSDIDFVLVMCVNPGFAGQKLVSGTIEKIKEVRDLLDENNHPEIFIEVDGNVSFENAKKMRKNGADLFVAGSSSVFKKELSIEENIHELREAIE